MENIEFMPKEGTQRRQVLDHLLEVKSLSGLEATALYRVSSLTKVISVLRQHRWGIRKEWRFDHTGKRYARYFIGG